MPRSGATIHFCKGCEAKGVVTVITRGHSMCAQCLAELRDHPDAAGVPPAQLIEVKAREEQLSEAVWCSIKYGVGSVLVTGFLLLETDRHMRGSRGLFYVSTAWYLILSLTACLIGAVVGWFIGIKRPSWKDMM